MIFFDEIDALAGRRGGSNDSKASERVLSQLLTGKLGLRGKNVDQLMTCWGGANLRFTLSFITQTKNWMVYSLYVG